MNREPEKVNRNTNIMAKLLAEIINDFFEPLTYKSLIFMAGTIIGVLSISEILLRRNPTI